jgi:glycosyltransferase involved in cell wall biosynthesis
MNNRPIPILILGDSPDMAGGLSRITRDIAGQLSRNPRFRVATLGRGAVGSLRLPFMQYCIRNLPGNMWGEADLPKVWQDFAGKERGIMFTIWDPTRTLWLSHPELLRDTFPETAQFIHEGHFDLWGYVTLDATGPSDKVSAIVADSLRGYRRLLAYTKWAEGVIRRSLGDEACNQRNLTWLPHGLDLPRWPMRDRDAAKARLYPFLHEGQKLVGAIGTNQPRKDWGLVASVCQQLSARNRELKFWWHTDLLERSWSIPALLHDFGLAGVTQVTLELSQEELSWRYTASDLTLHPGLGEGFGYPIFESLASGTPVLHGAYGGGYDVLLQTNHDEDVGMPQPVGWRLEGLHNQVRPVFDPTDWAHKAELVLGFDVSHDSVRASIAHLSWDGLWPMFERWFEEGL